MRPQHTPEIGEKAVTSAPVHTPSPEFRTRIESDVRFYLRQPSSPWITFDREGNAPILQSGQSSILPSQGVFPAPAYPQPAPAPEPSNMIVAADVNATTGEEPAFAPSPGRFPRRVLAIASVTLVAALAIGVGARSASQDAVASAATPPAPAAAAPPAVQPDPPPPDLAAAPAAAAPAKKAYGKLTIRGDARAKNVYMDGKRLLGAGTRTFAVICGAHSIAVGTKDGAHDVDVPCNGELVIAK
jgi:hypothetical protein